ncbi:MAG: amidohydrolase family protein [Alphaproteobacteria bacterium]|jgi:dihydroorotase|nr:amidohydrolase family protein [Alphaproteobacteria bacterium]
MYTLIKNCFLIDGINYTTPTRKDILLKNNIIEDIISSNSNLQHKQVENIIDLEDNILLPGLMDLHVHATVDGFAKIGLSPDILGKDIGTTSVFDAGTYGADTFDYFYDNLISKSITRTYAWLNVASNGLKTLNELTDMENINEEKIINTINKYKNIIVGLKARASASVVGDNSLMPIIKAKEIANKINLPLMVHIGNPPPYVDDVLNLLTKGDVITHCYHNKKESLYANNTIRKSAIAAKNRGVLFDVGHGNASFSFDVASAMIEQDFTPDFISTDIYDKNIGTIVKSQLYVISKLMLCGLSFNECIVKTTSDIAKKFNIKNTGELLVGNIADFTIIKTKNIQNMVEDSTGKKLDNSFYLEHKGTFIDGKYYGK